MLDKKTIVILYSKGRYDCPSIAIAEYFKEKFKDVYVVDVDNEEISPWKKQTLCRKYYAFAERNAPLLNTLNSKWSELWAAIKIRKSKKEYKEYKKPSAGFGKWIFSIKSKYMRVHNILLRFEPDVVLCATPDLAEAATKAKFNLSMINCTVGAIVTDYVLDKRFVNYKVDIFFVQNENIKHQLIEHGISGDNVSVVGTPVRAAIKDIYDRDVVMEELGIPADKINIVFVGGRYGSSNLKSIVTKCVENATQFNLIIMTDGSLSLSQFTEKISLTNNMADNIFLVDKMDEFAKIYAIADAIICTPTAQITYEAMINGKCLILAKGSDAIEKANAYYLISNGVAMLGSNRGDAISSLIKIFEESSLVEEMKSKQKELVSINSVEIIAHQLNSIMDVHYSAKTGEENNRNLITDVTTHNSPILNRALQAEQQKKIANTIESQIAEELPVEQDTIKVIDDDIVEQKVATRKSSTRKKHGMAKSSLDTKEDKDN